MWQWMNHLIQLVAPRGHSKQWRTRPTLKVPSQARRIASKNPKNEVHDESIKEGNEILNWQERRPTISRPEAWTIKLTGGGGDSQQ